MLVLTATSAGQTLRFKLTSTDLNAVCEHDADRHELGEDPEQLGVGQHTVLQAVIQEAGVMAEDVVYVGGLVKESEHSVTGKKTKKLNLRVNLLGVVRSSLFSGCSP